MVVNTAEHVRKLHYEQAKHDQTRQQYDEFLKSLVYEWNPLLSKWFIAHYIKQWPFHYFGFKVY